VGKAKKIGLGIGISVLIFFVMIIGIAATSNTQELQEGNVKVELKDRSFETLSFMDHDWDYRDLQRNIEDYEGELIFVEGRITNTQPELDSITLCANETAFECESMFVRVDGGFNYLEDDEIEGYVKVMYLSETTEQFNAFGKSLGSKWLPVVEEVKLRCTNC
jgi:hypothetical protein